MLPSLDTNTLYQKRMGQKKKYSESFASQSHVSFITNIIISSAHCQKDDEECLAAHLKAGKGITLPTRRLLKKLVDLDNMENRVDELLKKLEVPTIHVSFEKLFSAGDDVNEWTRIFRYP